MEQSLNTSEYIQDIEYGNMEPTTSSGASNVVYLIPAEDNNSIPKVFVWGCIGSGQPEPAYNNRWYQVCHVPNTAVPSEVEKVLRNHEELLIEISSFYEGHSWDGHNQKGSWGKEPEPLEYLSFIIAEAMELIPTYWEASNFFQNINTAGIVYDASTLSAIVAREVESGTKSGIHLDSDDVRDFIISSSVDWLNKNSDLEELDEKEVLLYNRLTDLLGE